MPDAPARPSDSGTVRIVTSEAGFAELRDAWNDIAGACRRPSVFLAHEWFDAAWQWRKANATLFILCHYHAERLAAVLPLVVRTAKVRGIPVRELAFLTVPDTQWCDMLVAECDEAPAADALAHELRRRQREWDVMRLKYLPTDATAGTALAAALARQGFAVHRQDAPGNPYIELGSTWDAFYATRSRRLKKANNLAANRLKRAGEARIDWHAPGLPGGTMMAGIEEHAIAVSAASWKVETGNSLENAGPQAFIRRLSALAAERRWLSIWLLTLDGRPVAMEYQLVAGGDVFALRSDFDAALEDVSPGSSLNRHLLERLFGRGLHRYYMGPGNNAYKHRWTELVEPVREMSVYGRSLAGRSLALWESSVRPAVVRMRDSFARQKTGKIENHDEE